MSLDAEVDQAVAATFAQSGRAEVKAALAIYKDREVKRVQLAILALADGNADRVVEYVDAACQDYRDVLYWAEYPDQAPGGRQTKADMSDRYHRLGVPVPESLRRCRIVPRGE